MTRDKSFYMYAWVLSPMVYFFAFGYTEIPNQIIFSYIICLGMLGLFLVYSNSLTAVGIGPLISFILSYYLAFYIVSFWELFPGTTIEHGKFELLNLFNAMTAYLIGRNYRPEQLFARYHQLGVLIIFVTVMQLIFDPQVSRYGYGLQLMLCLPVALMINRYLIVVFGIAVLLASVHKTPIGGAIIGLLVTLFFMWKKPVQHIELSASYLKRGKVRHKTAPLASVYILLALLISGGAVLFFSEQVVSTISRFIPGESLNVLGFTIRSAGVDYNREYVNDATLILFSEYFLKGIGYMNFYAWTGLDAGIFYTTNLDRDIFGVNLHNSYATWALEGGVLVLVTVILLFYSTAKKLMVLLASGPYRDFGILAVAWVASLLLYCAYHQGHMTMQFWSVVGLIFGFYSQSLSERRGLGRLA